MGMTSRERVVRALEFSKPDRVPRHLWRLPGVKMYRQEEVDAVLAKYPEDITRLEFEYGRGKRTRGARYRRDEIAADEWGCEWHVLEDGVTGEVKEPPIRNLSEVKNLKAPYEMLERTDFSQVNPMCAQTHTFTLGWTTVRPFERMQFLFGTEKLFIELSYASKEVRRLRDIVHEFFVEELKRWIETDVDGLSFMDDWGHQKGLLVSPEMWRDLFKPLYKDYCDLIHAKNKYAFFHTDGYITPIYPGLIEVGVDAINSQLFCMDIEDIGRRYKGKITFWGEIDRQHVLSFGTKEEVAEAVTRVKNALWTPEGGVIAQCEFGLKDPIENIETVFQTWESIV